MMAWVVEVPAPSPPPRGRLLALLRAELRQSWWLGPAVLGAGLGVWALLLAVTARVPTAARPDGVVFNYTGSLLLSVFPLLLSGPALTGLSAGGRLGLWLGLPVRRRTVNLLRLLGPALQAWPTLLTWPLILALLARVYGPVAPWLLVNTALVVAVGILLATRTVLAPFLVYALLPLQVGLAHFMPGGRALAAAWAEACVSPWAALGLAVIVAGLVVLVLDSPPPRTRR
jgi:hypothetical protein